MQVDVRELSPVLREVTVAVPAETVGAELDKLYRDLRLKVRIPGFRPGNAPRKILEQRFGMEINRDAASRIVAATIGEALRKATVEPVVEPAVQKEPVVPG